jgi:hypothetical protein
MSSARRRGQRACQILDSLIFSLPMASAAVTASTEVDSAPHILGR